LIGVNISGLLYHGGYSGSNMFALAMDYPAFCRELIIRLLADTNDDVLLIPHTYGDRDPINSDPDAIRVLFESLAAQSAGRLHRVTSELNAHEIKAVIGRCTMFVGARMHSCIAGLSITVPTVGIAYSGKFDGVFDTVGCRDTIIDARKVDGDTAVRVVLRIYRCREEIRQRLRNTTAGVKKQIQDTFQAIMGT
jgi:polysaccharide pyruvyl transferase WcaK-like protein